MPKEGKISEPARFFPKTMKQQLFCLTAECRKREGEQRPEAEKHKWCQHPPSVAHLALQPLCGDGDPVPAGTWLSAKITRNVQRSHLHLEAWKGQDLTPCGPFPQGSLLILAWKSLNPAKPCCRDLLTVGGQPARDDPVSLGSSRRPLGSQCFQGGAWHLALPKPGLETISLRDVSG